METPLYCSLDLELSGFDPLKNEILEVGFVLFRPSDSGFEIIETYSQVFRPTGEVHPKILGLTGISNEELAAAPTLNECRDFIQAKVKDVILVGHNISVDARFLEAFGFKLSGKMVDTLDLVQFLLPTHHSYNLENLMHYFKVAHPDAHRALADAQAVISVLENLLALHASFPLELKKYIQNLTARYSFEWIPLLDLPVVPAVPVVAQAPEPIADSSMKHITPGEGDIITHPLGQRRIVPLIESLADSKSYILLIPDKQAILSLWRRSMVHGVFGSEDLFSQEKLDRFIETATTKEEITFCLKILVWRYTNWQCETVVDMNFSFFGGQFRSLVTGGSVVEVKTKDLLCCDYATFAQLSKQKQYSKRIPIIWTTDQFEQWLNSGNQNRLTWNKALYLLKSVYNPETEWGDEAHKALVMENLAATDLFFALVNLLLTRHFSGYPHVTYEALYENEFVFNKLESAATNLVVRFRKISTLLPEGIGISEFADALESFFVTDTSRVKWIEVNEFNAVFFNQPLHIQPQVEQLFAGYQSPVLVNSKTDDQSLGYMLQRLGLPKPTNHHVLDIPAPLLTLKIVEDSVDDSAVLEYLQASHLPAVVLFQSSSMVRSFYDAHYQHLKTQGRVFAQGYSGGSNKIMRNFTINPASILLATPDFLTKSGRNLAPKTVIVIGEPEIDTKHPYNKALIEYWSVNFPNFAQMQGRQRFYRLLQLLANSNLDAVNLFSTTLASSWGNEWKDYIKAFDNIELLTGGVDKSIS